MAQGLYTKGVEQMALANINFETATIKAIFLSTSHTFDFTGDSFLSDISADRASNTTDQTLTNADVRIDAGNARVEFDSDNLSQGPVTSSTDKFALYKDTGSAATSPLIFGGEFVEGTLAPVNGTLAVTVNVEGYYSIPTS